jgi:hypothetical protein
MGPIEREGRALTEEAVRLCKENPICVAINVNCISSTVAAVKATEIPGALKLQEACGNQS